MTDVEIKARAEEERNRMTELLDGAGISEKRMKLLEPVILNTAWMRAKLDDAREAIKNSNIVVAYDNGGGQKGIRENPLFKGYENLWRSYMAGMSKIIDCLPDEIATVESEVADKPKTVLELVRNRHGKEA
jgi:hypothetical protein